MVLTPPIKKRGKIRLGPRTISHVSITLITDLTGVTRDHVRRMYRDRGLKTDNLEDTGLMIRELFAVYAANPGPTIG